LGLLLATMFISTAAIAEGGARIASVAPLPKYQTECASCHVAYPPALLPASSWQRLTSNLSRHFGVDASVDAATVTELTTWLSANAATNRSLRETPPDDRLTRSAWFIDQHEEVSSSTWKRPAIKSASNCAACHTGADKGDFSERHVRIPR
jgi:nitrate/TMAO reductase-like tetraheme cytochrome c subunit